MSNEKFTVITVASWEDRFVRGLERVVAQMPVERVVMLHSDAYASWTDAPRRFVRNTCNARRIELWPGTIYSEDPRATWEETLVIMAKALDERTSVIVDISTMPRDIIWQVLWLLEFRRCKVSYVYHRPASYGEWLSRDPGRPRMVYKLSGITLLGARTALVILAGYDVDRVRHLREVFEPAATVLGLQRNSVDPLNAQRMAAVRASVGEDRTVRTFEVDAFAPDHGMAQIVRELLTLKGTYNVVMASMGPKLTAASLYAIQRGNESVGLVYLPSREFNREYSVGITETIWGALSSNGQLMAAKEKENEPR